MHLLDNSTGKDRTLLVECIKFPDRETWATVKERIDKSDAKESAIKIAEKYTEKAVRFLDIFPASIYKDRLLELADYFTHREF